MWPWLKQHLELVWRSLGEPSWLLLLAILPVLLVMAVRARRRRRRVLSQLGRLPALAALTEKRRQWGFIRGCCLVIGLALLIVGIAGPRWGREVERTTAEGRDIVVVLDVSRSMLADDEHGVSRQQRAKKALEDMVANGVKKRGGHRLALVAFAAGAKVLCPLTHDYDHFLAKLAELDAASLPRDLMAVPASVDYDRSISGTRIGRGVVVALREAHHRDANFRGFQDVLLISDGDDPAPDNEWRIGRDAAKEAGIPIYTMGLGDPDRACRIPAGSGKYQQDAKGNEVLTKLHRTPLQEIAKRSKGQYFEVGTGEPPLRDLFLSKIEPADKREVPDDALALYRQRYPWFYGAALSFLAAELTFGAPLGIGWLFRRRKQKQAEATPRVAADALRQPVLERT